MRFIPYPVVGGFLAGTGWLLVQGSFGVMSNFSLTLANVPALLRPDQLILWVPGVLLALALFFGLRYIRHSLAMPGILIGAVIVFYIALLITGTSIQVAIDHGLLLGRVSGQATWQPFALKDALSANWIAIVGQSGNMITILVLSVIGLLLNVSGLERAIHQDIDLNREMHSAGLANLVSGLGGGMIGYHALSLSMLSYRMGARGRLPGLVAGPVCWGCFSRARCCWPFSPSHFWVGCCSSLDWIFWSSGSLPVGASSHAPITPLSC